jgi:hypothetical protein
MSLEVEEIEPTIESIRARRVAECIAEIEDACKRHKCRLLGVPVFGLAPGGAWQIGTRVDVVSEE